MAIPRQKGLVLPTPIADIATLIDLSVMPTPK